MAVVFFLIFFGGLAVLIACCAGDNSADEAANWRVSRANDSDFPYRVEHRNWWGWTEVHDGMDPFSFRTAAQAEAAMQRWISDHKNSNGGLPRREDTRMWNEDFD